MRVSTPIHLHVLSALVLVGCAESENAVDANLARIISVEAIEEKVQTPRTVCENVTVTRQAEVKDDQQIAGTASGAVIGGAMGNQIGGGSGRAIATAAGAVIGGAVGKKAQKNYQAGNTQTGTEQQCTTVMDETVNIRGYNVSYEIDGKSGSVRMDEPPKGDTIPVVNGQLVLHSVGVEQP
ncbi:glycine zipper 2TM domain-containing protein [Halioglobus sp. HI00S01]|uniref:glycine zipper 2TM domain-containing protein n=1 Tax=Halioglobus sp. HI00S01 TaxID=1822214 RepID=UPI000825FC12|nr:glycine zipper 2TM domain-containing protein [Halioglobus sp. HI00S01]